MARTRIQACTDCDRHVNDHAAHFFSALRSVQCRGLKYARLTCFGTHLSGTRLVLYMSPIGGGV